MTCPTCGAELGADDNFCLRCGTRVAPSSATSTWRTAGSTPAVPLHGAEPAGRTGTSPLAEFRVRPPAPAPAPPPPSRYLTASGAPEAPPAAAGVVPYVGPAIFPTATPRRGRLAGLIALGSGAFLLVLAAIALVWASAPVQQTPAGSSAEAAPLIAAVEANNQAQIAALRSLNPSVLNGKMTGQALADNQAMLQSLQSQGLYEEAQLVNIQYTQPSFSGTSHATIHTVETWTATIHRQSDGSVVQSQPAQTLHETYSLTRQNGTWVVDQVAILEDLQGTPGPSQ